MKKKEIKPKKKPYVEPKVIATYGKEELEKEIAPEGVKGGLAGGSPVESVSV